MEFPQWTQPVAAPMPPQRQRSRKACQPCRSRKRKCDGRQPCATCVRYEYDCYYTAGSDRSSLVPKPGPSSGSTDPIGLSSAHGKSSLSQPVRSPQLGVRTVSPDIVDPYKTTYGTDASAVSFPQLLGFQFGASIAPRLHSFAWNLGSRPERRSDQIDFTKYLSFHESQRLIEVYFNVVHPVYDFVDRDSFEELWRSRYVVGNETEDFDAVICGVAALGSLFTVGTQQSSHPHESELVNLAKLHLESTSTLFSPNQDHITAWILRVIYLRATTLPHASWLSSCTLMHCIEAIGLHKELTDIAVVSPPAPETQESAAGFRRRLFWVAWSLNAIISYEYGRSRVEFIDTTIKPIDAHDARAHTSGLVTLAHTIPDTEPLDEDETTSLQSSLEVLSQLPTESEPLSLLKADVAFSTYRRMRLVAKSSIPPHVTSLVISIGKSALPVVSSLVSQRLPWWTVLSVPFQFVCVLLAIDSRESLSQIAEAMTSLEEVGKCWNTHMAHDAVGCARLLVKLSKRRKEEDVMFLESSLPIESGPFGPADPVTTTEEAAQECSSLLQQASVSPGQFTTRGKSFQESALPMNIDWADNIDVDIPEILI